MEAVLAGRSHAAVAEQYGISKVWVGTLMAHWRTCSPKSIHWQCSCPHQNCVAAPRRIQQPLLPFSNSETGEAPRKVRPGSKGNHAKVNKVSGQGLTMSWDLTLEPPRGFEPRTYALRVGGHHAKWSCHGVFDGASCRFLTVSALERGRVRGRTQNTTFISVSGNEE